MTEPNRVARKLSAHSSLPAAIFADLARLLGAPHRYEPKDTLADPCAPADSATFVAAGVLCRAINLPDGRRAIASIYLPGDAVDLETLITGRRLDTIQALTPATVWQVSRRRFAELDPSGPLAAAILKEAALAAELGRAWVVNGRRRAREQMAHLLCEICSRMDAVGLVDNGRYAFPFKQDDLSDMLDLSVVHVNRVLQALRKAGLIEVAGRRLRLRDREALEEMAGFNPDYLGLSMPLKALQVSEGSFRQRVTLAAAAGAPGSP